MDFEVRAYFEFGNSIFGFLVLLLSCALLLQGNIPGLAGTTTVSDTTPANRDVILYRVGVPERKEMNV